MIDDAEDVKKAAKMVVLMVAMRHIAPDSVHALIDQCSQHLRSKGRTESKRSNKIRQG